jgi:hypothetical protein
VWEFPERRLPQPAWLGQPARRPVRVLRQLRPFHQWRPRRLLLRAHLRRQLHLLAEDRQLHMGPQRQAHAQHHRQRHTLLPLQENTGLRPRARQSEEPGTPGVGRVHHRPQVAAARRQHQAKKSALLRKPQKVRAKERNRPDTARRSEAPKASLARHHQAPKSKSSVPRASRSRSNTVSSAGSALRRNRDGDGARRAGRNGRHCIQRGSVASR